MSESSDLLLLLRRTLEDGRLTADERRTLASALAEVPWRIDQLQGLRNQAFAMLRTHPDLSGGALLDWLEGVVRTLDQARPATLERPTQSFFSPGPDCKAAVLGLLSEARASLELCVFTISDDDLTRQVLAAHQRGVTVRLLTDNDKRNDTGSDVDRLARAGVPVRIDRTDAHMHHKFAIADGARLLNGSFNWTRSATQLNSENVTVTTESAPVLAFRREFDRLWEALGGYG